MWGGGGDYGTPAWARKEDSQCRKCNFSKVACRMWSLERGRATGTLATWEDPPGVLSTLKLLPGESERRNGLLESQCVPEHMDSPRMVVLKA